jgi:hypothetical protein
MCHLIKSRRVGSWIDSYSSNHCIGFWVCYFCCLIWFLRNQSHLWSKEVTNLLFIRLVYCNVSKISKSLFEYDDVLWRLIFEMFFVFLFVKWWSDKMLFEFWTFFCKVCGCENDRVILFLCFQVFCGCLKINLKEVETVVCEMKARNLVADVGFVILLLSSNAD